MNAHDPNIGASDLAVLHYGDGEFAVLKPGRYVLCAVSGVKIPLEMLRYWSPALKQWVVEPGTFDVWAGGDSTATLHAELRVVE